MNITRFSIQRPVGITMIILLFVVLGLFSLHRIGVELLPALNTPYVTVSVSYPGAGVEEVEQGVIKPLENALSALSNLKHITSVANPGRGFIILELEFSANADYASIEATKLVNSVRARLPDGIDEPTVMKRSSDSDPIMEISVTSKYSLADTYSMADNVFSEYLSRANGVSDVGLHGGRDKEIAVEVDKDKLHFYNISMSQILSKLTGENTLLPAGSVYTQKSATDVRLDAQFKSPEEMRQLYVTNAAGNVIPLTEIATIKAQDRPVTRYSRTKGEDSISLSVYKNSDANVVSTADAVLEQLAVLQKEYPDYQFRVVTNSAQYVNRSLTSTLETLAEGIFTTSLILYLFLRGWRSTAAVLVAIPTSLISTFFMMYMAGFTFNMMSLMGMVLCIGVLVDDSIVVLENIFRHMQMGKDAARAAEEGRTEIGMAAVAITLCDVVVFMPIAFMDGMTGQYFRQFGLTIVFATLFSMFVSFTLTPMLASRLYRGGLPKQEGPWWRKLDQAEQAVIAKYEQILRWCLAHRKKVISVVLALFIGAVSLIPLGLIGSEYMPRTDEGAFVVYVQLPEGQNLDQTDATVRKVEEYILTIPEVTNCLVSVGTPSLNYGRLSVQTTGHRDRSRSIWQITDDVRAFARKNIRNATVRVSENQASVAGVSQGSGGRGGPSNTPVALQLRGSDLTRLVAASRQIQEMLGQVQGIKDVNSSYSEGMPELQITVDREKLKFYNTSITEVTNVFKSAISGQKAGVLANDPANFGNDTDITLRMKNSDGFTAADIRNIAIQSGSQQVLLGQVAQITSGTGPTSIQRVDKQRSITITANITDRPLGEVLTEIEGLVQQQNLAAAGVSHRFTGQATNMNDTFSEMLKVLGLSLILIYMLLAVLYESLVTPFIRMFSLPLGLIGALVCLAVTRNTLNLYSLIGILVMDGLVAKNGTLLLDYTLTLMEKGVSAFDAVIEAGKTRLRPIIMTTMTMVVGMLPTALAMAEGAETRASMAWVIIGGLLSSTVFTLVIIPIIFLFFEDRLAEARKCPRLFAALKDKFRALSGQISCFFHR